MMTTTMGQHRYDADETFSRPVLASQHGEMRQEIHERITAYLQASCTRGEEGSQGRTETTLFDVVVIPRSVEEMLGLVREYDVTSDEAVLTGLVLMQRYVAGKGQGMSLTVRNVRPLFLVALLVATKTLEDIPHNNATFANLAEIALLDVNTLEVDFLAALHFRLRCPYDKVVRMMDAFVQDVALHRHRCEAAGSAVLSPALEAGPASVSCPALGSQPKSQVHHRSHTLHHSPPSTAPIHHSASPCIGRRNSAAHSHNHTQTHLPVIPTHPHSHSHQAHHLHPHSSHAHAQNSQSNTHIPAIHAHHGRTPSPSRSRRIHTPCSAHSTVSSERIPIS